ncbi:MAG TPA: 50S ribosomal protein L17 [Patescibacteria group bacterium]|nr:50S ribosomal protein L17 [Patescibacteria group bacterium]
MRHRSATKHLSRDSEQRKSLFKNLLRALFEHGSIETTEAKAKAIKSIADKLVSRAQQGTLPARRLIAQFFGYRSVANRLVDEVAPAMSDRKSGFTRIVRLGKRRGDDSMMVKMELINTPEKKEIRKDQVDQKKTEEKK